MKFTPSLCRAQPKRASALAVAIQLALSTATFGSALLIAAPLQAQTAPAEKSYSIPAGALGPALSSYAAQAGVLLSFDPALTTGKSTQGLSGNYSVQAGFSRLLAGTGLAVQSSDGKNFVLERHATAGGDTVLPEVSVTASSDKGSAAAGYLVHNSSVAGFTEQAVLDTPFSSKTISAELLSNQQIDDVRKLDQLDASVTASAMVPGYVSTTYVRGFMLNGNSNYRYNGMMVPGNAALNGLENKEKLEVLKGLSALQAGFASPGGLLNYVTKRAEATPVTELNLSANQYGNAKVHVDLGRSSEDGRYGLRVNAAVEELRSFVDGADGDRQFLSLAFDSKLTPDTTLQLDAEYHKREQKFQPTGFVDSNGNIPRGVDPEKYLGQDWTYYPSETFFVGAKVEHALNEQWSLQVDGNFWNSESDFRNPIIGGIQPNGDATFSYYYSPGTETKSGNLRLMASGKFETGSIAHELAFGYSMLERYSYGATDWFFGDIGPTNIHNPVQYPKPVISINETQYRNAHLTEQALFFNDVIALNDAWLLHLGGRYAKRDDRSYNPDGSESSTYAEGVFTPSVAVVFKPLPNVSTYVSYIEGLESGGTAPLSANNRTEVMPPITSQQIELGVKAEVSSRLLLEAALFEITQPAEYVDGNGNYVQDGGREHRGLELSATGKLSEEWTLFASAMQLQAEYQETGDPALTGKRPTGVPEQRLVSILEYAPAALVGWAFNGNWSYTGDRATSESNTTEFTPAYSLFDLGARYSTRFGSVPATLRLSVENLLNKNYVANSVWGELVQGEPRTATASLSLRF